MTGWGEAMNALGWDTALLAQVHTHNEWFLPELVQAAVAAMSDWWLPGQLEKFARPYPPATRSLRVGIIMAGNLPLVGLHDLLCVWLSGHTAIVKLSSKDALLLPALVAQLPQPGPVEFVEELEPSDLDFLLATGSDNTARYLEHRFAEVPRIVRRNRFSVAVLQGEETPEALAALSRDILLYHGMGCRSVSSLLVPEGYDTNGLVAALNNFPAKLLAPAWRKIQRWEAAMQGMKFTSQEFASEQVVLQWHSELTPARIGVIHLLPYAAQEDIVSILAASKDKIQCVVGHNQAHGFGKAQFPQLDEFADGVDVMAALANQASTW